MVLIALSAIIIGGLLALGFGITYTYLYKEKQGLLADQNKLLRSLAEEYKQSYQKSIGDITYATKAHRETLDSYKQLVDRTRNQRTEEWEMLYTLCELLERNGTVFEPDSVLERWWMQHKGTLTDDEDQRG